MFELERDVRDREREMFEIERKSLLYQQDFIGDVIFIHEKRI